MSSDPSVSPEDSRRPTAEPPAPVPATDATSPVHLTPETGKFTRAGALWAALAVGMLILIVLLVFITQNMDPASLTFLGWHWRLPLGVAMLVAAICGGLVTVLAGTVRIFQLRRAAKRDVIALQ